MAEGILNLTPNKGDKSGQEPEKQPEPIPHEYQRKEGRRWPVILIYGLLALLIAITVVFAGRWVYREVTNNPPSPKSTPTQAEKSAPNATKESSQPAANSQTPASASNPGSPQTQSNTRLPKTGDDPSDPVP